MTWTETARKYRDPVGALRMALFLQIIDRYPAGRLLDLGTGHGIFASLAADCGWEVTGVDARAERFPSDTRVTWVKQDMRDTDMDGYDIICALGLWYHLTLADQLDLARRANGAPLMIDTHIALHDLKAHERHKSSISKKMVTQSGYEGRTYFEGDMQDRFTASFKNESSFWPTEASLRRELTGAGYDIVETFDPPINVDRRYFLATRIDKDRSDKLHQQIAPYCPLA